MSFTNKKLLETESEIMDEAVDKKSILQILSLSGVLAVIFYVTHVIAGRLVWRNYNPFSQPISDLTAETAISKPAADIFVLISCILIIIFCVVMLLYFKREIVINKLFYFGIIIKTAVECLSFFAHIVFPLEDTEWGINLQNILHNAITGIVILGYIAVSIIMTIGIAKTKKYPGLTKYLIVFSIVFICSAFLIFAAALLFRQYIGLIERINLYSLQLTNVVISLWMFKKDKINY